MDRRGFPYFLQSYADSGDILSPGGLDAFSEGELQQMLQLARKHCPKRCAERNLKFWRETVTQISQDIAEYH